MGENLSLHQFLFRLDWIRASGAEIEQQLGESGSYASFTQSDSNWIVRFWGGFKEVQWDQQNVITISSGLLVLRKKTYPVSKTINLFKTIVRLLVVFVLLIRSVEDCLGSVAREEFVKCENYLDFPRERLQSGVEQRQREGEQGFCPKTAPRTQWFFRIGCKKTEGFINHSAQRFCLYTSKRHENTIQSWTVNISTMNT